MLTPILPPELERIIFELSAWQDRATALKLLVVARRAHIWIEPLFWKVILLDTKATLGHLLPSNGPAHIKDLAVNAESIVSLAETNQLLSVCPNITNLALWTVNILPDLGTELQQPTKLTRLSINISLLDNADLGPAHFAPLLNVSHFEVYGKAASLALLSIFRALPALTHLAFAGRIYTPEVFKAVLQACDDSLRLLVFIFEDSSHFAVAPGAGDISMAVAEEEIADSRFCVVECLDPIADWLLGAWGGRDFWCRGEERVAERARARQNAKNAS
ncbi:hypothetical protein C8F01DRAFT_1147473 [Mycena amicta]|nr:hypothetical protein C8F01DRAFT_1147473 [Mycena amicta]